MLHFKLELEIRGVAMALDVMDRLGGRAPILFLHGFGSTKEDYADLAFNPAFDGRRLIAYDAPGCGESVCSGLSALSIPFLMETALAVIAHLNLDRFHLSGHSMGGLTALKLAHELQDRVLSFTNIEGNVAPEDCFLSRQILDYPEDDPQSFMDAFQNRIWHAEGASNALYAASLKHKVRASAVAPIFRSMVELSDNEPLFDIFTGLPCPKMFVYGDENRSLTYLGRLQHECVQLCEIEGSGHFPMYANPKALWRRMGQFIDQSEMNRETAL